MLCFQITHKLRCLWIFCNCSTSFMHGALAPLMLGLLLF